MGFVASVLIYGAAQLFWIHRALELGERFIPGKPRRAWLGLVAGLIYVFFFAYSFPSLESTNSHIFRAADWRLSSVIIEATFWWWLVGSLTGFVLVIFFGVADRAVRGAAWAYGTLRSVVAGHTAARQPDASALDPPHGHRPDSPSTA